MEDDKDRAIALLCDHADDGGQHGGCAGTLLSAGHPARYFSRKVHWPPCVFACISDDVSTQVMLRNLWFARMYDGAVCCIGHRYGSSDEGEGDIRALLETLEPPSCELITLYFVLHDIPFVPYSVLHTEP